MNLTHRNTKFLKIPTIIKITLLFLSTAGYVHCTMKLIFFISSLIKKNKNMPIPVYADFYTAILWVQDLWCLLSYWCYQFGNAGDCDDEFLFRWTQLLINENGLLPEIFFQKKLQVVALVWILFMCKFAAC